jgi:uncharacterized protein
MDAKPAANTPIPDRPLKHPLPQRVLHWFNAACFLFLWGTGIGLVTTSGYRLAPQLYIDLLTGIFGSSAMMLKFHIAVGVVWFGVLAVLFLVDPYGLSLRFLRDLIPTRNDLRWMLVRPKAELDPSVELPPQGAYNAGQKAFGWTVLTGVAAIATSGIAMWIGTGGSAISSWMVLIHLLAVGAVITFFFVHFTMAALVTEERPALISMFTGKVTKEYAEHHHAEWAAEQRDAASSLQPFALPRAVGRLLQRLVHSQGAEQPFWSPYAAGIGIGLTVLAAFVLLGHGMGASGLMSRLGAFGLAAVAPDHVAANAYWGPTLYKGLTDYWLLWSMIGIGIGGFLSAGMAGRLKAEIERGALVSPRARIALAIFGGVLVGFGTRLARGCTSHQALAGGALLSQGSWVFMLSVFAGGFAMAFFLRRIWR